MTDARQEAERLTRQGDERLDAKQFGQAIATYDRALALDARLASCWVNKGLALWHLERAQEALSCYERALEIDAQIAVAWMNKGNALHSLGHPSDEVIACYDRALQIDSKLARAWFNKGDALARERRFLEARACFENARDLGLAEAAPLVAKCEEILMNDWYA